MGVRGWCFIFKITTRIIFFKKILNKNLEILTLNSKRIGDPSQTLCMYKLFPDPNPNPYVPSSIKKQKKSYLLLLFFLISKSATAMAEGSLSMSRLLRQYEDRPFIIFSSFNWFKPPLVTDNGVIKTQIEWYSI